MLVVCSATRSTTSFVSCRRLVASVVAQSSLLGILYDVDRRPIQPYHLFKPPVNLHYRRAPMPTSEQANKENGEGAILLVSGKIYLRFVAAFHTLIRQPYCRQKRSNIQIRWARLYDDYRLRFYAAELVSLNAEICKQKRAIFRTRSLPNRFSFTAIAFMLMKRSKRALNLCLCTEINFKRSERRRSLAFASNTQQRSRNGKRRSLRRSRFRHSSDKTQCPIENFIANPFAYLFLCLRENGYNLYHLNFSLNLQSFLCRTHFCT